LEKGLENYLSRLASNLESPSWSQHPK
jgi:hypothetical protein